MIVIDMDMPKNCVECKIECKHKVTAHIRYSREQFDIPQDCPIKCDIEDIKAELISLWGNEPCSNECGCLDEVLEIIDKHTKGDSNASN